jgi:uncharacterized protein YoxC
MKEQRLKEQRMKESNQGNGTGQNTMQRPLKREDGMMVRDAEAEEPEEGTKMMRRMDGQPPEGTDAAKRRQKPVAGMMKNGEKPASPSALKEELMRKKEEFRMKKDERKATREARIEDRCEDVTAHVDEVLAGYNTNHQGQVVKHEKMLERLRKMNENLIAKGYETADLVAAVQVLGEKIEKLNADHETFIGELEDTKEFACGESEGAFKTAMEEARAAMKVVRADVEDIRTYYRDTIRPAIEALKAQKPDVSPSPEDDTSGTPSAEPTAVVSPEVSGDSQ